MKAPASSHSFSMMKEYQFEPTVMLIIIYNIHIIKFIANLPFELEDSMHHAL